MVYSIFDWVLILVIWILLWKFIVFQNYKRGIFSSVQDREKNLTSVFKK